jgi:thiosulfate/3-mercaptopyruvate sulfurtransferase
MSPLIEITDLLLTDKSNLVIIDARGFAGSYDRYLAGHLEGALFVDLDRDLAAVPDDAANGGRHPLPPVQKFADLLTRLGISPHTHVVVYDDKFGANSAARFWWMLKAIGHQQLQVLNGGLQSAIDHGVTLSIEIAVPKPGEPYPVSSEFKGTVAIDEVGQAAHNQGQLVIDVRENARYLGQTEPIDLVAGHIPGAINVPFNTNLDEKGRYRSADELKAAYTQTFGNVKPEDVIVHCGSGVTACHTLLALEHAGLPGAGLYVGSWSEWSRRDLPVGKENRY